MKVKYYYRLKDGQSGRFYRASFFDFGQIIDECISIVAYYVPLDKNIIGGDTVDQFTKDTGDPTGKSLDINVIVQHPLLAKTYFRELS